MPKVKSRPVKLSERNNGGSGASSSSSQTPANKGLKMPARNLSIMKNNLFFKAAFLSFHLRSNLNHYINFTSTPFRTFHYLFLQIHSWKLVQVEKVQAGAES